jgi:hypothetical protein
VERKPRRVSGFRHWTSIATFAGMTVVVCGCRAPQIGARVTPALIRSVEIGMTEQQVTDDLGPPLRVRPWGKAVLYDYAVPGWAFSRPSVWIALENGTVQAVHVKRHRLMGEDQTVYEARTGARTFESPDFESAFNYAR